MARTHLSVFALTSLLAACSALRDNQDDRAGGTTMLPDNVRAAPTPLRSLSGRRNGSQLLLAVAKGRQYLLVADDQAEAVRLIDPWDLRQHSMQWVGGRPGQLLIGDDGRVYVAQRDTNTIAILEFGHGEPPELRRVGSIPTDAEPHGLALSNDGRSLWVTAAWGHSLASYSIATKERTMRVVLPREPRALSVTEDGQFAYVTHALGARLTRVSLPSGELTDISLGGQDVAMGRSRDSENVPVVYRRTASQGFALVSLERQLFAPGILIHRGPRSVVDGYGERAGFPSQQPVVATLSAGETVAELRVQNHLFAANKVRQDFNGDIGRFGCMLPRAAAVDKRHHRVLVACVDRAQVMGWSTNAAPLSATAKGRWSVPAGPMGIDVDDAGERALVWSQFDRAISIIPLARPQRNNLRANAVRTPFGCTASTATSSTTAGGCPTKPCTDGSCFTTDARCACRPMAVLVPAAISTAATMVSPGHRPRERGKRLCSPDDYTVPRRTAGAARRTICWCSWVRVSVA